MPTEQYPADDGGTEKGSDAVDRQGSLEAGEACKRALMEAQERILDSMSPEQLWQLLATVTQGGVRLTWRRSCQK